MEFPPTIRMQRKRHYHAHFMGRYGWRNQPWADLPFVLMLIRKDYESIIAFFAPWDGDYWT